MISKNDHLLWEEFKQGKLELSQEEQQELTLNLISEIERMQKEVTARREQELHLEWALCSIADGVAVTSKVGQVRLFNPAFSKMVNCFDLETNFWNFWITNKDLKSLQEAMQHKKDWSGLLSLKSNNNRVGIKASPITDTNGLIDRWVFTLTEKEEALRLQERVTSQKQLLERILDAIDSLVFVINSKGEQILDNLAAKTLLADIKRGKEKELIDFFLQSSNLDTSLQRIVCETIRGDRSFVSIKQEIPAGYLFDSETKETLYLITMTDFTALEEKEFELQIKSRSLELRDIKAKLSQREFAKSVIFRLHSHLYQAQAALKVKGLDKTMHHLKTMHSELESYRALKPEESLFLGSCQVRDLTKFIKIMYQDKIKEDQIIFFIDGEDLVGTFPINEMGMLLMTSILIDNAIESFEHQKTRNIKVTFKENRRGKLVTVEDSGPGILPKDKAKIFEPLNSSKTNKQGLSLTLLHRMVGDLGCDLELFPSSLGGAGMQILFPEAQDE